MMIKKTKPFFLSLLLLLTVTSSCQKNAAKNNVTTKNNNTKRMDTEKFYWQENINSPLGFPVEVYKGGLEAADGSYVSLSIGPHTGNWGDLGSGMSSGVKAVPNRLNVTWISFAENVFYDIDTEIDYDKMVQLFKEGYQEDNKKWGRRKEEYKTIIVGFAPGGVAVIWLAGAGKQVEIGRYLASKIKIQQAEIDKLDSHDKLLFDEANVKRIMTKDSYVPLEVQKANANKPIPFGLWDNYRKIYNWNLAVEIGTSKVENLSYTLFNGERDALFSENIPEKNVESRAIPRQIAFGWRDESGQLFSGLIKFKDSEITTAFESIQKKNPQEKVTLQLSVNKTNTFLTVALKYEDQTIALKESDVNVFKSKRE